MRLVVEEAADHSACMEKIRNLYGADCVVVHSFRVDDLYRVVVALETASHERDVLERAPLKTLLHIATFCGTRSLMRVMGLTLNPQTRTHEMELWQVSLRTLNSLRSR